MVYLYIFLVAPIGSSPLPVGSCQHRRHRQNEARIGAAGHRRADANQQLAQEIGRRGKGWLIVVNREGRHARRCDGKYPTRAGTSSNAIIAAIAFRSSLRTCVYRLLAQ
jgi:hypothetical protein